MQPMRGLTIALLITFSIGISLTARAQPTDPGFPYVDVNNDGVYSPASGDIPLTSGQILSVIQSIGYFDTQRSVNGIYHAPDHRASLVIPRCIACRASWSNAIILAAIRDSLRKRIFGPVLMIPSCFGSVRGGAAFDISLVRAPRPGGGVSRLPRGCRPRASAAPSCRPRP